MKFRWLVAIAVYLTACVVGLAAPWPYSLDCDGEPCSDASIMSGRDLLFSLRLCWMAPVLVAAALVWATARHGVRSFHTEVSMVLAGAAAAYPFVGYPECGVPLPRDISTWIQSSAAAFVLLFAGRLGWKAFFLEREQLRMGDTRIRIS